MAIPRASDGVDFNDAGPYDRGALLGDCAWFTVHAATRRDDGERVVVKDHFEFLLDVPGYAPRLLEVLDTLAGIDHPDLVGVLDVGWDGARLWSAEQFVNGRSLLAWLAEGWVTPELAVRVVVRVLSLLELLHGKGIVHGCLHPGTIRMAGPDEPRLGDFGLVTADPGLVGPHSTGTFGFYRPYLSPGVLAGRGSTKDDDLFSVGVLLRECLGGKAIPEAAAGVVRQATGGGFGSAAEMADAVARLGE